MQKVQMATIDSVLARKVFAVAGVSRSEAKFGTMVYRKLKEAGYEVHGINPSMDRLGEDVILPDVASLPDGVEVLVTVVPPAATEDLVKSAHARGIQTVWMQQGSENTAAIEWCQANGMDVVWGQCIMMFAPKVEGIHRFHKAVNRIFGQLPR